MLRHSAYRALRRRSGHSRLMTPQQTVAVTPRRIATTSSNSRQPCDTTVVVAMSGGIDSAATAMLLKDQGYKCIGVHMVNWDKHDESGQEECPLDNDSEDMQEVCQKLHMPSFEVNLSKEYWNFVFEPFLASYESGRETPNPDMYCNRYVKFKAFKELVCKRFHADMIATGHYARIVMEESLADPVNTNTMRNYSDHCLTAAAAAAEQHAQPDRRAVPKLLRGVDHFKDQSYFLSLVHGENFRDVLFPLGNYTKVQVKAMVAQDARLRDCRITKKKESMGICFVGKRSMPTFLSDYMNLSKGNFIDLDTGVVLGQHSGSEALTVGQKARIGGLADKYYIAKKTPSGSGSGSSSGSNNEGTGNVQQGVHINMSPLSVPGAKQNTANSLDNGEGSSINSSKGDIYVVNRRDHPALYSTRCVLAASRASWVGGKCPQALLDTLTMTHIPEADTQSSKTEKITEKNKEAAWFRCTFKMRHGQETAPCKARLVSRSDDVSPFFSCSDSSPPPPVTLTTVEQSWREAQVEVVFEEAQRAVTAGQVLALYDGDECLGGIVL